MHLVLVVMTIANLFTQMSENLSKVPADMTATEQARLVRAANAGLGEFVEGLPAHRRREPTSSRLDATLQKTITATAASKDIVFDPTFAGQTEYFGRTVLIGGDHARPNRLLGTNALWLPHEGTTGSTTLDILSDAVLINGRADAVDGEVWLHWSGEREMLTHGKPAWLLDDDTLRIHFARPQYWWTEPLNGISGGASPLYCLRVWPMPDAVYTLSYHRRMWPTALTTSDFASTDEIPVLPREEFDLVNLCQAGMLSSPLWVGTANKDDMEKDAERASTRLAKRKNNPGHTQPCRVGTARGY